MTTTTDNTKEIAAVILQQLGGNKFIAMTGSKNFGYGISGDGPYLKMMLAANKSKTKYLVITLAASDTYIMQFFSLNKDMQRINEVSYKGVYDDMLQSIFTKVTGFDTHM